MSVTLRSISSHAPVHGPHPARHVAPTAAHGQPLHDPEDAITEWLLEQPQLDANGFAVLFAIHQLNARRGRSAWIRRSDLCRSSGLNQVSLTRVLTDLRHQGLVGMSRHPSDSSRACYMLIVR